MKLNYKAVFFCLLTFLTLRVGAQAPNITYLTPQTYTINKAITPLMPANTGGAVPATTYGQVGTLPGLGISYPSGVITDAAGNIYATSYGNGQIVKITPAGVTTTLTNINSPSGITIDSQGNLYVTSFGDNLIYKVTPGGVKTVFAGSGAQGDTNGPANAASFFGPGGISIDASGNLLIADQSNNKIRKITPAGQVTTIAGTGLTGANNGAGVNATFNNPDGLAVDAQGNIYVADTKNNMIRKITPAGLVSTFAGNINSGSNNGIGTAASFNYPTGVTIDMAGNVLVADYRNNLIRKITPDGQVTTLAGSGVAGNTNGTTTSATFNGPLGLNFDVTGNLYVTDFNNGVVRKIILTGYTIDKPLPAGMTFDAQTGFIKGTPTVASPPTVYTITAYNVAGSSTTTVNIQVVTVPLTPSIINFPSIPINSIDANNNITPGATSNNHETPIVYTSDNPSVAIITAGGLIHLVGPGIAHITANQAGNDNYSAAAPAVLTLTVTQSQGLYFPAIAAKTTCNADFTLTAASTNNTLPVFFNSSNTAVATVSATGVVHIVGAGTTVITLSQPGNDLYVAATPLSQTLTVRAPVNPSITVTPDNAAICKGATITFTATAANQGTAPVYQWQVNGVNAGSNSATFASNSLHTGDKITCTVTNTTDCSTTPIATSTPVTLTVNDYVTPLATITSSVSTPVCAGTAITFTATPANAGASQNYQWQVNGSNAGTNSPTFTSTSLQNGDVVKCVITALGSGCFTSATTSSNSLSVSIAAPQTPAISVTASANNVYGGSPVTFIATVNPAGSFDYQWQVNGVNAGDNSTTFTSSTLQNGDKVTCTVSNSAACVVPATSTAVIMVVNAPTNIPIPNTFTPNGDGVNDYWNITPLTYYPNCLVNIYDRYGSPVLQSRGYTQAWDGTTKGKPVPVATYYYVIDLGVNQPKLSGSVTIIR